MALKDREEYNAYMRKYLRERHVRRRAAAVEQLGGKCVDCGNDELLEFDHVDPATKEYNFTFATLSETKLQAELVKCVLRCRGCHMEKSKLDNRKD